VKSGADAGTYQKVSAADLQRKKQSGARSCAKVNDENENDPRSRRKLWVRIKSKLIRLHQSVFGKPDPENYANQRVWASEI